VRLTKARLLSVDASKHSEIEEIGHFDWRRGPFEQNSVRLTFLVRLDNIDKVEDLQTIFGTTDGTVPLLNVIVETMK
jgi:hypothetical protein